MALENKNKINKNKEIKRRRPIQARARQLVVDILEATAQVLEEEGYESLSTNRIAERAGVSIGSIYQYFSDKNELLDAVVQEQCEQLSRSVLSQFISIMDKPFPAAAQACISMYVEFLASRPALTQFLLEKIVEQNPANPNPLVLMNIDEERALQLIDAYLLRHQQTLGFADLKAATYMVYHVSSLMGMRIALSPDPERQQRLQELVRMLSLYVGAA